MRTWKVEQVYPDDFIDIAPSLHTTVLQYFWNRGVTSPHYINAMLNSGIVADTDPHIMKDMLKANKRVLQAIDNDEGIIIFGDYDADGITATSIMYLFLTEMQAKHVVWYIPSRLEGYGANPEAVSRLVSSNSECSLLITVDNGIKATKAVTKAVELGLDVIVTDHHSVDYSDFPNDAYAVVNPQQDDCPYPEVSICGAVVAYKFVCGMAQLACDMGRITEEDVVAIADKYVDLACIGTVADMMPLSVLENRSIVMRGLNKIATNPRLGVYALAQSPDRGNYTVDLHQMDAIDMAFGIIPHINAAGRIGDGSIGVKLLTTTNPSNAQHLASQLIEINEKRKLLQNEYMQYIQRLYEKNGVDTSFSALPIVIEVIEKCPKGIVGLVAGNITQHYGRPSAVLTDDQQNTPGVLTASARSVPGFDIAEALRECDHLLVKHGGHEMAAGFSIHKDNLPAFVNKMKEIALRELSVDYSGTPLHIDSSLPLAKITYALHDALSVLSPHTSVDWPLPLFVSNGVYPAGVKQWGRDSSHLKLEVSDGKGNIANLNGWRLGHLRDGVCSCVDIVYSLELDEYSHYGDRLRLSLEDIIPSHYVNISHNELPDLRDLLGTGSSRRI